MTVAADAASQRRSNAEVPVLRETVPQVPREALGLNDCADSDFVGDSCLANASRR